MHKDIADLWILSLRDPQACQIKGALETSEGHCCLGKLTREFMKVKPGVLKTEINERSRTGVTIFDNYATGDRTQTYLLDVVMEWAGMKSSIGECCDLPFKDSSYRYTLTQANDDGVTFSEIADFIETYWKEL